MGGHYKPQMTGGVRVFSIGGRMVDQRERLLGMTNEERRWRAQFLKDQILSPQEPVWCPEYYKATQNIFVRLFSMPMNLVQKAVTPIFGGEGASTFRYTTGRLFAIYVGLCLGTYYMKYHTQDWTRCGGWYDISGKPKLLPGNPDFPTVPKKEKYEYCDRGFSKTFFW